MCPISEETGQWSRKVTRLREDTCSNQRMFAKSTPYSVRIKFIFGRTQDVRWVKIRCFVRVIIHRDYRDQQVPSVLRNQGPARDLGWPVPDYTQSNQMGWGPVLWPGQVCVSIYLIAEWILTENQLGSVWQKIFYVWLVLYIKSIKHINKKCSLEIVKVLSVSCSFGYRMFYCCHRSWK